MSINSRKVQPPSVCPSSHPPVSKPDPKIQIVIYKQFGIHYTPSLVSYCCKLFLRLSHWSLVMFSPIQHFLPLFLHPVNDNKMEIKNSYTCTHFSNVSSVDDLIRQHCSTGANIEISSWNGRPKPLPWSKWMGKVSLPKIL